MVAHAFNPITLESGASKSLLNSSQSTVHTKFQASQGSVSRKKDKEWSLCKHGACLTEGLKIAESAQSCTVLVVSSCGVAIYLVL